ncbi:MAG: hypothetical protein RBS73_17075 [Prolixibacteraceae bacterium]|jgi:hypothetical protein|nr:hypothetical protein [Prolixibacteraceae bacterium]
MKAKFFFFFILFLGFSAITFAQATTADPVEKKDAPAVVTTPDHAKTGECTGHTTTAKADCKWVDANGDGKCDSCGKTEKECKEACAPKAAATTPKSGCASTCPHAKECGKSTGTPPKGN